MKPLAYLLLGSLAALLASCQYKAPLSSPQNIKIDPNVLGQWEEVKDGDDKKVSRMLVIKFTETEYLVHFPTGKDGLYFRAYPIKIGGVSCVQIQIVGSAKGQSMKEEQARFDVMHYALEDDNRKLVVKKLNGKVVSPKLTKTAELKEAFLKNKDHKELWKEPGTLKKIEVSD